MQFLSNFSLLYFSVNNNAFLQAMKKQSDRREHGLSLTLSSTASTSSNTSQDHQPSVKKTKRSSKRHSHPVYLPSSRSRYFYSRSKSPTPDNDNNNNNMQRFNSSQSPEDPHNSASQFTDMSQCASSLEQISPRSSMSSYRSDYRKQREHSHRSTKTSDYRRYNGTVNHYGRHSNDWLFGGFSLRDTVRGGVDRLRHHGHGKEG